MRPRRAEPPLVTAAEYARMPEDGCRHELQTGVVVSEPPPDGEDVLPGFSVELAAVLDYP